MVQHSRLITRFTLVALVLTFVVIGLGAYTRLTNSGLSCPDWPGCYGMMGVPTGAPAVHAAQSHYGQPVIAFKAWAEMIHRYCAGFLGLIIIALFVMVLTSSIKHKRLKLLVPMVLLLVLLGHQVMLGKWTVTYKLMPVVVSLHLLFGMLILALLWWVYLNSKENMPMDKPYYSWRFWSFVALVLVLMQIILGAWTSSNYAAISCAGFPACHLGNTSMQYDFRGAFNIFSPVGVNYEGGVLSTVDRQTIQMVHRFGALIVGGYLFVLVMMRLWYRTASKALTKSALIILLALGVQVMLGILTVLMDRPLEVAVLHNLTAAVLLLSVITFNYYQYYSKEGVESDE